jgi:hypothetical protein
MELIDSLNNASQICDKYYACIITGDLNLQINWKNNIYPDFVVKSVTFNDSFFLKFLY